MKRSIWIFFLAIVLPSIGLGWMAFRGANEQQIILERRTAELYQKETDAVASAARSLIDEERRAFVDRVRQLKADASPVEISRDFATKLSGIWNRRAIGFALSSEGNLISPSAQEAGSDPERQKFLQDNGAFLSGTTPATVYSVPQDELNRLEQRRKSKTESDSYADSATKKSIAPKPPAAAMKEKDETAAANQLRNVEPQRQQTANAPAVSQLVTATADFRALTSDHPEGVVTRFMQDRLEIVFWLRLPEAPGMIFGCLMNAEALSDRWPEALTENTSADYVLALLNDKARPVTTQPPNETARDWRRPFLRRPGPRVPRRPRHL